jgi:hypothetical protein
MSPRSPTSAALVLFVLLVPALARASPAYCVKTYFESLKRDGPTLGISASDAQRLVQRVSESIGLQSTAQVIPCSGEPKAYAWPGDGSQDVPDGQYIIYDPDWVREVIGKDQVQAVALFGHELGHFLNQDFTVRRDEERRVKERDADHFAGCAVAKVTGDFSKLEDLLSRLRLEKDTMYPDRLTSIETAKAGFASCGPVQVLSYGFKSNSFSIAATGERFEQARPLVWHEMSKDGRDPSFVFQEKAHTETEIILYDVSRNFYLRLPIPDGLAQWRVGESGPWSYWYASTYHK